jgi:hypothetical protein
MASVRTMERTAARNTECSPTVRGKTRASRGRRQAARIIGVFQRCRFETAGFAEFHQWAPKIPQSVNPKNTIRTVVLGRLAGGAGALSHPNATTEATADINRSGDRTRLGYVSEPLKKRVTESCGTCTEHGCVNSPVVVSRLPECQLCPLRPLFEESRSRLTSHRLSDGSVPCWSLSRSFADYGLLLQNRAVPIDLGLLDSSSTERPSI